jgi:MIP family channel proteins
MATTRALEKQTRKSGTPNNEIEIPFWKCLLAEVIGTFFLTLVSAAPIIISRVGEHELDIVAKVVPAGGLVASLIYVVGPLSGAHFNPAVTLAFCMRRAFPWTQAVPYWLAQFAGGFAAAGLLLAMFGNVEHLGANVAHVGVMQSFVLEIVLTFLLVTVILGTSQNHRVTGPNAALAVGMTIALCGLVGGEVSGGSMNPARSLCPAIAAGYWDSQWVYLAGPVLGSLLAVLAMWALHGPRNHEEKKAGVGGERTY